MHIDHRTLRLILIARPGLLCENVVVGLMGAADLPSGARLYCVPAIAHDADEAYLTDFTTGEDLGTIFPWSSELDEVDWFIPPCLEEIISGAENSVAQERLCDYQRMFANSMHR